ncbi:MAG: GPP34 family phosphoprotein [Peptococcaceae bacterium]|nr:GPP34 family phosphoprotein [Peptococcaceae bacterium]
MKELSVMQQYAICAVNEKGKISTLDQNKMVCLIVAGLLELELDNCIVIDDKIITSKEKPARDKVYLKPLYAYICDKEPVKVSKVVNEFYMTFTDKLFTELLDGVMDALRAQGLTEKVQSGFFGNKESLAPSEKAEKMVVTALREQLLADAPVDETTAALVILLDKGGCLKAFFSKEEMKAMKERLKVLAATENGKIVADVIRQLDAIMTAIVVTTVLT